MENHDNSLWDPSLAAESDIDKLQTQLSQLAAKAPSAPPKKRGYIAGGIFAAMTILLICALLPLSAVPSRIAGIFYDNFPGEIGVRGGTRAEYLVPGHEANSELTSTIVSELSTRGANVVYSKPGSVIVDLVGLDPDRAKGFSKGIATVGSLELTLVDEESPFMNEVAAKLEGHPAIQDTKGVTVGRDLWTHLETGSEYHDTYLRGTSALQLDALVDDLFDGAPPIPTGRRLVYEQVKDQSESWTRSYLVFTEAAITEGVVQSAEVALNPYTNKNEVLVQLTEKGTGRLASITGSNTGKKLAIIVDGEVIVAPTIQSEIAGGTLVISIGDFQAGVAEGLASALNSGKLSAPIELASLKKMAPVASTPILHAARFLFALPFAFLAFLFALIIVRKTAPLDPEVFPVKVSEGISRRWVRRTLITLLGFLSVPLLSRIPLPGLNVQEMQAMGATVSDYSVVVLGLAPVLLAFLIVELAALLVPRWQLLRHAGPAGRSKLSLATMALALLLASMQAVFFSQWLMAADVGIGGPMLAEGAAQLIAPISLVAGVFFLVLIAHWVSKRGFGNGLVIVLAGALVSEMASTLSVEFSSLVDAGTVVRILIGGMGMIALCSFFLRAKLPSTQAVGSIDLPTSGVVPLCWVAAAASASASEVSSQQISSLTVDQLLSGGWLSISIFLTVSLALVVLCSLAFSLPARFANRVKLISPRPPSRLASKPFWIATSLSGAFVLGCGVFYSLASSSLAAGGFAIWTLPIVCALVMDLVTDIRAHYRNENLVPVWPLYRGQLCSMTIQALVNQGIDAHARGQYFRRLFYFFAPFAPITIMVPEDRSKDAESILASLLGEQLPSLPAKLTPAQPRS